MDFFMASLLHTSTNSREKVRNLIWNIVKPSNLWPYAIDYIQEKRSYINQTKSLTLAGCYCGGLAFEDVSEMFLTVWSGGPRFIPFLWMSRWTEHHGPVPLPVDQLESLYWSLMNSFFGLTGFITHLIKNSNNSEIFTRILIRRSEGLTSMFN